MDHAKARLLYEEAADAGVVDAWVLIGMLYSLGHGLDTNLSEAVQYYRRAAEAGSPDGQHFLGWSYHQGAGVESRKVVEIGRRSRKWYICKWIGMGVLRRTRSR